MAECDHISFLDCNGNPLAYGGNLVSIQVASPSGNTFFLNNSAAATAGFSPTETGNYTVSFITDFGNVLCSFTVNVIEDSATPEFVLSTSDLCFASDLITALSCSNCSDFWAVHVSIDGVVYSNFFNSPPYLSNFGPGPHTVCVTGLICDNENTECLNFTIGADLDFTTQLLDCRTLSITNNSTCSSDVVQWLWNFGDGTFYNGQHPPVHTYAASGSYTVSLTVIYNNGQTATQSAQVNIVIPEPIVISGPTTLCCETLVFSVPAGFASYQWAITPPVLFGYNSPNEIFISTSSVPAGSTLLVFATATTADGCEVSAKIEARPCCTSNVNTDPDWYITGPCNNGPISYYLGSLWQGTVSGPQTIVDRNILIDHDMVIDQTGLVFDNCRFYISGGVNLILEPGISIDFTNSTFNTSCDEMWGGVLANHSNNSVNVTKCGFFQAINALVFSNGAQGNIQISNFENCHKGVVLQNFAGPGIFPVGVFEQNSFQQTGNLLYPHLNRRSFTGIEIKNAVGVTIGQITTTPNTFNNLDYGIYAENSSMRVINNRFSNISLASNSNNCSTCNCPTGTAVCSNVYGLNSLPQIIIGGTSNPERNQFFFNRFGFEAYGSQNITVRNNNFFTHQEAVGVNNATKSNIEISASNTFNRYRFGTGIYNCFNSTVKILNNNYTQTTYTLPGGATSAIYVNNFSPGAVKLTISGNSIDRSRTGIYLIQVYGLDVQSNTVAQISNNTIDFTNLAGNGFGAAGIVHSGIRVEASQFISIKNNTISKPGVVPLASTLNRLRGIWLLNGLYNNVYDNTITRISQGVYVAGQNQFSYFFCNDFYRCYHGFQFAGPAAIPSQMFSLPTNNGWYFRPANNSDLAGQISVFPLIDWYYSGTSSAAFPTTLNLVSNSISNNNTPTFTSNTNPACAIPQFQGPGGNNREALYGSVVRNENTYDPSLDEYKLMEEEVVMASFFRDSSLVNAGLPDDSVYVDFFTSRHTLRQGKYAFVQYGIEKKNYGNALSILNQLQPQSQREEWFVELNEKLVHYFASDSGLSVQDSVAFLAIALENSVHNVTPVHQA
ncbi:MAG: PKD domain-containing protein, partial [Flavobacteriales bacterium]